jgi:hypothetical protein
VSASILITLAIIFPVIGQEGDSQDTSEYQKIIMLNGHVATGDFTWNPQDFAGFYYDLDGDIRTEMLTTTVSDGMLSGSFPCGLNYQTTAQEKPFRFKDWGYYSVIGFLGKECLVFDVK